MKRSEMNSLIESAISFFDEMNFKLPVWAYWTLKDWKENKEDFSEIINSNLGWDLTDFGLNDFKNTGLILFTIRNGNSKSGGKTYCEKIMIANENQVTPRHYHMSKTEDIINRGGGNLVIELFHSHKDDIRSRAPVIASIDGIRKKFSHGDKFIIKPGESICLPPYLAHKFYAEKGKGRVLIGEVSAVNDDENDNCFYDEIGRFPTIEEDESLYHLLISDYEKLAG